MDTLKFEVQNLLEWQGNKVTAPMSPLLFAQEMVTRLKIKFNRLARVCFEDERINQCREDGGLTGHDTLIIGIVYTNDIWLSLWVDSGVSGVPVAEIYKSDMEIEITSSYNNVSYDRKLTEVEIRAIFSHVLENMDLIAIACEENE